MILGKLKKLRGEGHIGGNEEQKQLLTKLIKGKSVYLETGFNIGHSAFHVLSNNPDIVVYSFDIGRVNKRSTTDNDSFTAYEILKSEYGDRLHVTWGNSVETLPACSPLSADVLFIDGCHSYKVAKADIENMKKHSKADSVVLMDDLYREHLPRSRDGTTRAWEESIESKIISQTAIYRQNRRSFATGVYCQ